MPEKKPDEKKYFFVKIALPYYEDYEGKGERLFAIPNENAQEFSKIHFPNENEYSGDIKKYVWLEKIHAEMLDDRNNEWNPFQYLP